MCSALTMEGAPTFNGQKLTKRAKRLVGFVLQVRLLSCLGPPTAVFAYDAIFRHAWPYCITSLPCRLDVTTCSWLPEQDDLLYETLTVHETLYYAAMLRLPSTMTVAQKEERVLNVIHTLGLDKCRDTIVGAWSAYMPVAHLLLKPVCRTLRASSQATT